MRMLRNFASIQTRLHAGDVKHSVFIFIFKVSRWFDKLDSQEHFSKVAGQWIVSLYSSSDTTADNPLPVDRETYFLFEQLPGIPPILKRFNISLANPYIWRWKINIKTSET